MMQPKTEQDQSEKRPGGRLTNGAANTAGSTRLVRSLCSQRGCAFRYGRLDRPSRETSAESRAGGLEACATFADFGQFFSQAARSIGFLDEPGQPFASEAADGFDFIEAARQDDRNVGV